MNGQSAYAYSIIFTFFVLAAIFIWDMFLERKKAAEGILQPEIEGNGNQRYITEICIFIGALIVFYLFNRHQFIVYNNYSYFAEALLHGKLSVPTMPQYLESIEFKGFRYMHFAPGPSLLCIPFVAVFGVGGFNTAYLCMALGAANALFFYKILENMGLGSRRERIWLSAFAVLGTVHFFLTAVAHSWFLGHVATLFFLLIAMVFITVPNPKHQGLYSFYSGLFFGLAVTCRISTILGVVFFAGYIIIHQENRLKNLLFFAGGAAIPGFFYILYNYIRFGTFMDLGYNLTYMKDKHRPEYDTMQSLAPSEQLAYLYDLQKRFGGPLQLQYMKTNLYSIFLLSPKFTSAFPYVIPTMAGVSVTFTSPALYFAVLSNWKKPLTYVLWATALLAAIPFTLNYGNGMAQFGMRYSMDFTPYLLLLACGGLLPLKWYKKAIILLCILLNAWGPLFWNNFYIR